MEKIHKLRYLFNHSLKRRLKQPRTLDLSILTSKYKDSFAVTIKIRSFHHLIFKDFRLLRPGEVQSEARAWWLGYEMARRWADTFAPELPLYVRDDSEAGSLQEVAA